MILKIKVKYSSSFIRTIPSASESHRICTKLSLGSWAVTTGEELHLALKIFCDYILTLYVAFVKRLIIFEAIKKELENYKRLCYNASASDEAVSSRPS